MNYMDYTPDSIQNLFTFKQSERMTATLNTFRVSLQNSSAVIPLPVNNAIVEWKNCFGGVNSEGGYAIATTSDNGSVIAGGTNSSDGDVSGQHGCVFLSGCQDYWVLKLDQNGILQWQKCLGGSSHDVASSIIQTFDMGYIVAGTTYSNDGDVTGNHGSTDSWIVKLNSAGEIEWQKCLGGSSSETTYSIKQTSDKGFIVAGSTASNDGDISGNHGILDFWVVKLDSLGEIEWQKCLGGTGYDEAYSTIQTIDGGYLVCGYTDSNDGNVSGNHGYTDYWIVKLSSAGILQWQKCLGGTFVEEARSVIETNNQDILVVGWSASTDGDISGNHGDADYWIIKLNSNGGMLWQKCLGGTGDDEALAGSKSLDGGYYITGLVSSNNGDVTDNHGGVSDIWTVKIDSLGNLQWQRCTGGSQTEFGYAVTSSSDGGCVISSFTNSSDGDVVGNHGSNDYFIVKLNQPSCEAINSHISVVQGLGTFCSGDSAILQGNQLGGNYQWLKNGIAIIGATQMSYTAFKSGKYSCLVSNAVCSEITNSIQITVNKKPNIAITPGGIVYMCAGNTTVLTAVSDLTNAAYQWYKSNTPIFAATSTVYSATGAGKYTCRVTNNSTGCTTLSKVTTIKVNCRLSDANMISIYPNPANDKVIIGLDDIEGIKIVLTDVTGKKLKTVLPSELITQISVEDLAQGIYFITLFQDYNVIQVKSFVKN